MPATYGGPKLIGVDLSTDRVIQTILFPTTVAFADSYLNDVRFDLRPHISTSGKGVAYITDSSTEGRNGIVVVDLGSGESWRHLDNTPEVRPERGFVASVWGETLYSIPSPGAPLTYLGFGSDGIALGADGEDLYWTAVASRTLYSVSTERLRDRGANSELLAQGAVRNRGEKGVSDGLETDTNGYIYAGNLEHEAISFFNPANGSATNFVRDPRINWVDTSKFSVPCCTRLCPGCAGHEGYRSGDEQLLTGIVSTGSDGYLYFVNNQLNFLPSLFPGTDRRVRPFTLMRAKLPGNGTRVSLQ